MRLTSKVIVESNGISTIRRYSELLGSRGSLERDSTDLKRTVVSSRDYAYRLLYYPRFNYIKYKNLAMLDNFVIINSKNRL